MLTKDEAKELVLAQLKAREETREVFIVDDRTIERPFGWVFSLEPVESAGTATGVPSVIIVNKHVKQVVASSIDYTPERFLEIYEVLLTKSQVRGADWCLSLSLPIPWRGFRRRRVATKATEMGLYEIK